MVFTSQNAKFEVSIVMLKPQLFHLEIIQECMYNVYTLISYVTYR